STSTCHSLLLTASGDQRARLSTWWNALQCGSICSPICRRAAVTVRRPRANTVPTTSVTTFFQVGAVNSGSKCAKTAIMELGKDIGHLLVELIVLSSASILQQRSLQVLSSQKCTKSIFGDVLAVVRRHLWGNFTFPTSPADPVVVLVL